MKRLPKANALICGVWLAVGLLMGVIAPAVLWFVRHRVVWGLVIAGAVVLLALVAFRGSRMEREGTSPGIVPFDPETQYAVIRCSICTGEKVAGFKNKADGHFTEVMLIRSPGEEQRFMDMYHLDSVKTEY